MPKKKFIISKNRKQILMDCRGGAFMKRIHGKEKEKHLKELVRHGYLEKGHGWGRVEYPDGSEAEVKLAHYDLTNKAKKYLKTKDINVDGYYDEHGERY